MPTELERAHTALRRADEAGDTAAAKQLARYIKTMTGNEQGQELSQPFVRGLAQQTAQGATFGASDEIVGAGKAIFGREGGETFGDAYIRHRDAERAKLSEFSDAYPKTAFTSEMAGGILAPGLAGARAANAGIHALPTMGGMALRGAGAGIATGAAFGVGKADEMQDAPIQALLGAATGGTIGGILPPAAEALKRLLGRVPMSAAGRRLAIAMGRDKQTPAQVDAAVARAQALGRPINRADVGGPAMRRELETVAQRPGSGASLIETTLTNRNKGQLNRLTNDFMRATGVKTTTLLDEIGDVMARRKKAADPLYKPALAFRAEQSPEMVHVYQSVIKTPLGKQALAYARKILNVESFDDAPLMHRIDALKQGMDDVINTSKRAGKDGISRRGVEAKAELVELIDSINPAYKPARDAWAGPTAYLNAIEDGRGILARSKSAEEVAAAFSKLGASEQEAYRLGAVNAVVTRMRQDASKEPNLLKLIRSPEVKDKLSAIIPPKMRAAFFEILNLEDSMHETSVGALRGAQTAQRIAAQREQSRSVLGQVLEVLMNPLESLRSAVRTIQPREPGTSERSGEAIARSLLSPQVQSGTRLPRPTLPVVPGATAIAPSLIAIEPAIPGESGRN